MTSEENVFVNEDLSETMTKYFCSEGMNGPKVAVLCNKIETETPRRVINSSSGQLQYFHNYRRTFNGIFNVVRNCLCNSSV